MLHTNELPRGPSGFRHYQGADRSTGIRHRRLLAAALVSTLIAAPSLVATSPASAAGTTLHILQWANAPAVVATQQIDAAFEKANPGVNVVLSSANSQTSAWNTLVTASLAAKDVDVLAQFATLPILAPPPQPRYQHRARWRSKSPDSWSTCRSNRS